MKTKTETQARPVLRRRAILNIRVQHPCITLQHSMASIHRRKDLEFAQAMPPTAWRRSRSTFPCDRRSRESCSGIQRINMSAFAVVLCCLYFWHDWLHVVLIRMWVSDSLLRTHAARHRAHSLHRVSPQY